MLSDCSLPLYSNITSYHTDTHPQEWSIQLYSIDELLKACSKIGSNFSCITLFLSDSPLGSSVIGKRCNTIFNGGVRL